MRGEKANEIDGILRIKVARKYLQVRKPAQGAWKREKSAARRRRRRSQYTRPPVPTHAGANGEEKGERCVFLFITGVCVVVRRGRRGRRLSPSPGI